MGIDGDDSTLNAEVKVVVALEGVVSKNENVTSNDILMMQPAQQIDDSCVETPRDFWYSKNKYIHISQTYLCKSNYYNIFWNE